MTSNNKSLKTPETVAVPTPMVYVKTKPVWEYRRIIRNLVVDEPLQEEELNKLGADGWELAGVLDDAPLAHFYLKRLVG
jgi:hypothetical protein